MPVRSPRARTSSPPRATRPGPANSHPSDDCAPLRCACRSHHVQHPHPDCRRRAGDRRTGQVFVARRRLGLLRGRGRDGGMGVPAGAPATARPARLDAARTERPALAAEDAARSAPEPPAGHHAVRENAGAGQTGRPGRWGGRLHDETVFAARAVGAHARLVASHRRRRGRRRSPGGERGARSAQLLGPRRRRAHRHQPLRIPLAAIIHAPSWPGVLARRIARHAVERRRHDRRTLGRCPRAQLRKAMRHARAMLKTVRNVGYMLAA